MELGIDTNHPIDNSGFSCPRSPGEDKDLVLDGLVNGLFLNGFVVDPQIFFNLRNSLVDFLSFKWSLLPFFQQSTDVTANPFLRKEEAVVKNLSIHVLDLVFLDEVA